MTPKYPRTMRGILFPSRKVLMFINFYMITIKLNIGLKGKITLSLKLDWI